MASFPRLDQTLRAKVVFILIIPFFNKNLPIYRNAILTSILSVRPLHISSVHNENKKIIVQPLDFVCVSVHLYNDNSKLMHSLDEASFFSVLIPPSTAKMKTIIGHLFTLLAAFECSYVTQPVCRQEPREVCTESRVPHTNIITERQCSAVPTTRQECSTKQEQQCYFLPETKCFDEPKSIKDIQQVQECQTITERQCNTLFEQQCDILQDRSVYLYQSTFEVPPLR